MLKQLNARPRVILVNVGLRYVKILYWIWYFPKCLVWKLSCIILQLGISELMTNKLLSLVIRDFYWSRMSRQPCSFNQVCDWYRLFLSPYCAISNHPVTGSITVTACRCKFYSLHFLLMMLGTIICTQFLFHGMRTHDRSEERRGFSLV